MSYSTKRDQNNSSLHYKNNRNKENKIIKNEIPKLSLINLQRNEREEDGGGEEEGMNQTSPPLQRRDLERVNKGYSIINSSSSQYQHNQHNQHQQSHHQSQSSQQKNHYNSSSSTTTNLNSSSKLNGSGKYPPLVKVSETFSESFQDDMNYICKGIEHRDQRNRNKLPPRDLKPINHQPIDPSSFSSSTPSVASLLLPGHKPQSQKLPSLSRPNGLNSLQQQQPLNLMLKSNSLSKIVQEDSLNSQSHHLNQNKKSLTPLNHSSQRNLQPIQSTRPW